jgi:hypothetical protein
MGSGMAKSGDPVSELVRCAEVVERELRRLEELSRSARHVKLSSEKNITRAARGLEQALEQQDRLARELRVLGQAMQAMQARQEAAMGPLEERAREVQARVQLHAEHMQRFGALGLKARDAVAALREISEPGGEGDVAREATLLIDADEQVRGLVEEAKAMASAADADDFPDIAREAHALGQRVQAMRERLSELLRARSVGAS